MAVEPRPVTFDTHSQDAEQCEFCGAAIPENEAQRCEARDGRRRCKA